MADLEVDGRAATRALCVEPVPKGRRCRGLAGFARRVCGTRRFLCAIGAGTSSESVRPSGSMRRLRPSGIPGTPRGGEHAPALRAGPVVRTGPAKERCVRAAPSPAGSEEGWVSRGLDACGKRLAVDCREPAGGRSAGAWRRHASKTRPSGEELFPLPALGFVRPQAGHAPHQKEERGSGNPLPLVSVRARCGTAGLAPRAGASRSWSSRLRRIRTGHCPRQRSRPLPAPSRCRECRAGRRRSIRRTWP